MASAIGDSPANMVQRVDAIKILKHVAKKNGPVMANRTASYVGRAFNWAVDAKKLEQNLLVHLPRHEEKPKPRCLTTTEVRSFWKNAPDAFNKDWEDFYKLILLTGLRPGEMARLKVDQVDLAEKLICLPETKDKTELLLPLRKQAHVILKRRCKGISTRCFTGRPIPRNPSDRTACKDHLRMLSRHLA